MTGPFDTPGQVMALPAVEAIYAAMRAPSATWHTMPGLNHRALDEALEKAGVPIGAQDHSVIFWLSGFPPEQCAVIISWLESSRSRAVRTPPVAVISAQDGL
jgi:hypothetical protein